MQCCFQYGGNSFTLHINEGIPLERAIEIEQGFKELHEGIYTWGNKILKEAIRVGYIESADGWKLHLPQFNKFSELHKTIEDISKEEWKMYKEGKIEYRKSRDDENYTIVNSRNVEYYRFKRKQVSDYFKLKSEYSRLALNNPIQSRAAHQLKRATFNLFEWIVNNNYTNTVKICNTIHDEIVAECPEELIEIVKEKVQYFMIEGGNYYLTNLTIKAEAHSGYSWLEAK